MAHMGHTGIQAYRHTTTISLLEKEKGSFGSGGIWPRSHVDTRKAPWI